MPVSTERSSCVSSAFAQASFRFNADSSCEITYLPAQMNERAEQVTCMLLKDIEMVFALTLLPRPHSTFGVAIPLKGMACC